jgi:hypothetical protein
MEKRDKRMIAVETQVADGIITVGCEKSRPRVWRIIPRIAALLGAMTLELLPSCKSPGYDARYDCQQKLACNGEGALKPEEVPPERLDTCIANSQEIFDKIDGDKQASIEHTFLACRQRSGCAYVACVNGGSDGAVPQNPLDQRSPVPGEAIP